MVENQTIKDRLFMYIDYKGISARAFSLQCGFSANYATNISKGIPEDKMNRISEVYPELNIGWLMTGEGTMLRDVSVVDGKGNQVAQNVSGGKVEQTQVNGGVGEEYLKEVIEEQKTIIEQLQKQVAEQGATIQRLVDKM